MCIHCLGHFSPLLPSLTLSPLPLSLPGRPCSALISNFVKEHNKEGKVFLLVELRVAMQRDSWHCFHVQMCYIASWFISNWALHWFLIHLWTARISCSEKLFHYWQQNYLVNFMLFFFSYILGLACIPLAMYSIQMFSAESSQLISV
jgi:hypothetical protein